MLYLSLCAEVQITIPQWTQPHVLLNNMLAFLCLGSTRLVFKLDSMQQIAATCIFEERA